MAWQRQAANLGCAPIQDMKEHSFALLYPDRLSVTQHTAIDRERGIAHFVSFRQTLCERGFHGSITRLFERLDRRGWGKEIHRHVPATAKSGFELLEYKKYFSVVPPRLISRLDVHGADLTAVLSSRKVRACSSVRVIKAKACWLGDKHDPALSMSGNKGRALLGCAIHICRHLLAMPVQLFRYICVVVDIDCDPLPFL